MLYIITCVSKNNIIGYKNKLPWPKINIDMKHFINITKYKTIVMGGNTFRSIGPLLKRKHIIISNNIKINKSNVIVTNEPMSIVNMAINEDLYVIGGEQIYKIFLPYTNKIFLTKLHNIYKGDTFFPKLESNWKCIYKKPFCDETSKICGKFLEYENINKFL